MELVLGLTPVKTVKRTYPGVVYTVRISDRDSNNAILVADFEAIPGAEPPRHVHHREDEIFIMKEGTATFFVGDDIIQAKAGDIVYLPVHVPHHFKFTSEKIKATMIATPATIEDFFRQMSVPCEDSEMMPVSRPTEERIQFMMKLANEFGMEYVGQ